MRDLNDDVRPPVGALGEVVQHGAGGDLGGRGGGGVGEDALGAVPDETVMGSLDFSSKFKYYNVGKVIYL